MFQLLNFVRTEYSRNLIFITTTPTVTFSDRVYFYRDEVIIKITVLP